MQYGRYQEKMKRRAAFFGKLYRRRIPILAALVGVIAATLVVILTKGLIVTESDCPSEMVYGERSGYRVLVLWGFAEYEYRPAGSTAWTTEKPVFPGDYQVRAVGKTAFGHTNYTEIHEFTLLPREITPTVADSRIKYGETPEVKADLARGDELICEIEYESVEPHTRAWVHRYTVKILGKDGSDRTAAYVIADTPKRDLEIIPRDLEVTVRDASKVYDDLALTFDAYEVSKGTVLEGDRLVAVFDDHLTDAGTLENRPRIRVLKGVQDVTGWYNIKVRAGKLTVDKRPLVLRTASASFVYEGRELDHRQYTLDPSTSLAEGHWIQVTDAASLRDCGETENLLTFRIHNQRGKDVTDNYSLFVETGSLTVTPREVYIHSESAELTYSGTKQGHPYVTVENGVGDECRAEAYNTICDVGSIENILKVRFFRGGKDITSNYIIKGYTYGTITVSPRPVTVEISLASKEYDGTPLTSNAFKVLNLKDSKYPGGLVMGHSLSLETMGSVVFGSTDNRYVEGSALVRDSGGADVTKNYSITVIDGVLNVTPRHLTLKTESATKFYDGTPLTCDVSSYDETRLLPGHTLCYEVDGSRTDAGKSPNTVNPDSIRILDDNGKNMSVYYFVSIETGTLRVRARPLTIRTDSHEWVYDGRAHSCDHGFEHVKGTLADGHRLRNATAEAVVLVNAGTAKNRVKVEVWQGNENMTANYEITYELGTLTVHRRPVTIRAEDMTVVYDGLPHSITDYRVDESLGDSLVRGHSLLLPDYEMSVCYDVGTYTLHQVVHIVDSGGTSMNQNYDVIILDCQLTILRRPLHFCISGEKIYDGLPFAQWPVAFLQESSLVEGHTLDVQPVNAHLPRIRADVYHTPVDTDSMRVLDATGKNVTRNYSLHWYDSTVTIHPRPIAVKTADAVKLYDGLPLTAGGVELTEEGYPLVESHSLELSVSGAGVEVGVHPNTCDPDSLVIRDADGQDVTDNYKIESITEGVLTVQYPVRITVTAGSAVKTADGLPLTCGDYTVEITEGTLPEGFAVNVAVYGILTNVGRAENIASVTVTDGAGKNVTALVDLTVRPGVLVILSPEGAPSLPEDPEEDRLILIPAACHKVCDGTYLYPSDELVMTPLLARLIEAGYTYEVVVAGAQREIGHSQSLVVSFTLYDPQGVDVTAEFPADMRPGLLSVTGEAVEVFLYPLETFRSDTPAVWGEGDYEILRLPEGVTLELEVRMERTDEGVVTLSQLQSGTAGQITLRILRGGADVTGEYTLVLCVPEGMAEYPLLTVKS